MRLYFMLLFLISGIVIAGTNNLPVEHAGTIQLQHVNKFQQALAGDMVPRNTSGNVTDLGANLGTAAYRWSIISGQKLNLIQDAAGNAVSLAASTGTGAYTLKFPPALPAANAPVYVDQTGATTFAKPAANIQISSGTGSNVAISGSSYAAVTNLSVTLTTTGRPVYIGLIGDSASGTSGYEGFNCFTNTNAVNFPGCTIAVRFYEGTNLIYNSAMALNGSSTATFNTQNDEYPPSMFNTIYVPTAGTYTYTVQASQVSQGGASVSYVKLVAYEFP